MHRVNKHYIAFHSTEGLEIHLGNGRESAAMLQKLVSKLLVVQKFPDAHHLTRKSDKKAKGEGIFREKVSKFRKG